MVRIYAIVCSINDRRYVGSTAGNLAKRFREHRCLLRAGAHKCGPMQSDWTMHGEAVFGIRELENSDAENRRDAELSWMRLYQESGRLYNEHLISMSPPEGAPAKAAAARVANGYRPSVESNEKRRLAQLGKPKGHGAKISATKRAKAMR